MANLPIEYIVFANTLATIILQIMLHVWQRDNIHRAKTLTEHESQP